MARMPGAVWQGEHGSLLMQRYDVVCIHTIVGYAPAHAAHFSVKANGTILQSRDTRFRSGANLEGNHRVIAIENEDHGPAFGQWNTSDGHAVPALTPAQVAANAKVLRWAHQVHGVPLQLCPDSRPTSRGLAYHRQGIDGNFATYQYPGRVAGGEVWTKWPGKVCPGDRRISQREEILRLAIGGAVTPPPDEEDDDMKPHKIKVAGTNNYAYVIGELVIDKDYLGTPISSSEIGNFVAVFETDQANQAQIDQVQSAVKRARTA